MIHQTQLEISDAHVGNLVLEIPAALLVRDVSFPPLLSIRRFLMVGDTRQVANDSRVRKASNRQSRSCKVCRLRKVKVRSNNLLRARISDRPWSKREGPLFRPYQRPTCLSLQKKKQQPRSIDCTLDWIVLFVFVKACEANDFYVFSVTV